MTITEEEVYKDYQRFIRHEAMRANCLQSEIMSIINFKMKDNGETGNS